MSAHDTLVPTVVTTVDMLSASGLWPSAQLPGDPCRACGCRLGGHLAVMPGGDAADELLTAVGTIECWKCPRYCGFWIIAMQNRS